MNPFSPDTGHDDLERKLRRGARVLADRPAPELSGRILAAVRATPRATGPLRSVPGPQRGPRPARWIPLAAAAAGLLLALAWYGTRDAPAPATPLPTVASGGPRLSPRLSSGELLVASRDLFTAGNRVLRLPTEAEDSLRTEAELLLEDATRAAERIVGGLARPLREPLRVR